MMIIITQLSFATEYSYAQLFANSYYHSVCQTILIFFLQYSAVTGSSARLQAPLPQTILLTQKLVLYHHAEDQFDDSEFNSILVFVAAIILVATDMFYHDVSNECLFDTLNLYSNLLSFWILAILSQHQDNTPLTQLWKLHSNLQLLYQVSSITQTHLNSLLGRSNLVFVHRRN